jgi:hypothetical protein
MKYIFFSILLLLTQKILCQTKHTCIKVESNEKGKHSICNVYVTGLRDVMTQTIVIPTTFYLSNAILHD